MMNRAIFSSIFFSLTVAMAAVAPGCAGAGDPIEGDGARDPVEGDRVRDPVVDDDNKEAVGEESLAVSVNKCPTACVTFSCDCKSKYTRIWSRPDMQYTPAPGVPYFMAMGWTWNGVYGINRSLIEFDLSTIPMYSTILSATLNLYGTGNHSSLTHPNTSYLKRIIEPWNAATATWSAWPPNAAGQPMTTNVHQAILPMSAPAAPAQSYAVNVKDMVQDMMDPSLGVPVAGQNYGFMLQMEDENTYAELQFASCSHPTTARPSLTVCWKEPIKKPPSK